MKKPLTMSLSKKPTVVFSWRKVKAMSNPAATVDKKR
jgi:hypothetical protein